MLTRERIRELIDQHGLVDRADEIMAEVCPSIHLTLRYDVDEADIPIGASKMGGSPDVPEGFEFPTWNDRYLAFIAQIRLSDAKPYDLENLLPAQGMLYFFFEQELYYEQPFETHSKPSGEYRVIYVEDETLPLHRIPHPISEYEYFNTYLKKTVSEKTHTYQACPIVFEREWTPSSLNQAGSKQLPLPYPSDEWERYYEWWRAAQHELSRPRHHLLGVEFDIQFSYEMMATASKAWDLGRGEDWMLLLQVDTDVWTSGQYQPGFSWGDDGLLFFCINKDELRARRFDRIWFETICY